MPAHRAAVAAVLVVLVLTTLSSSLLGGKIFASDDIIFVIPPFSAERPPGWVRPANPLLSDPLVAYHPLLLQMRADLSSGTLPLWNPNEGTGIPLLGYPQTALLFPLTWLAFLLPFWSSLVWIAAAKLLLTSTGMYLYCRELRLRRGSSLLGAIAFAFGLFYFVWLEHLDVTNVWAILPWMFLAARWVCTRGSLGAAALLGGTCGLAWLGGHTESSALLLGATAAYGAYELITERARGPNPVSRSEPWRGPTWTTTIPGRAALLIGALALGVGASAVVTVPFLEFLHQSPKTHRGGPPLPLRGAWSFFFPELWGSPNKAFSSAAGPINYNERTAYIGAIPFLFALASIGRHRPREQWFFVGLAVLCLATIYDTPIWANAVRSLPDGKAVQLSRLLILVSFSGAVLAAYGLDRWLTGSSRDRRQMLWMMGIVAALPPLAWIPRHTNLLSSLPSALGQLPTVHYAQTSAAVVALGSVWRWILVCGLGIAGLVLARRVRSPAFATVLVIVITSVDLVTLDHGYHGSIPLAEANPPVPSAIRYLQAHRGDARVTASGGAFLPKLPTRYGLPDPRVGDQPVRPSRFERLWTSLGGIEGGSDLFWAQGPNAQRLADIFATRYVLLGPGEPTPAWLKPVLRTPGGTVALNRTALPRTWIAYDWRQAHAEPYDFALTVGSTTSQLLHRPVIERAASPPSGPTPPPVPARVTADHPQSVTVEATARRPGYLILDDSVYPGWQASVDGRPVPWTPANENSRAVPVPAGRHVIRFTYHPSSVRVGAIVSAVCVVVLVALAAFGVAWRRRYASQSRSVSLENA